MEKLRLSNTKPTKTKSDLIRCGKVNSSCSTSGTHRITNEFGSFVLMLSVIKVIFRYLLYNDFIFNIYSNGLRTSFHNLLVPLFKYIIYISTIYRRMLLVTYCDLHLDDLQMNALSDIL